MHGDDRLDAMKYIEDDGAFDAWLKRYAAKMSIPEKQRSGGKAGVSKARFFAQTKGTLPQPKKQDGQKD